MVKVRAKELVYHNHRRYKEGEVFEVPENMVSKRSMELVDGAPPQHKQEPVVDREVEVSQDDDVI